jgi:hypothetical protein
MNEKSRERDRNRLDACQSGQKNGQAGKRVPRTTNPHWPLGLQLSGKKDMTCFIPENLAVILTQLAYHRAGSQSITTTLWPASLRWLARWEPKRPHPTSTMKRSAAIQF